MRGAIGSRAEGVIHRDDNIARTDVRALHYARIGGRAFGARDPLLFRVSIHLTDGAFEHQGNGCDCRISANGQGPERFAAEAMFKDFSECAGLLFHPAFVVSVCSAGESGRTLESFVHP